MFAASVDHLGILWMDFFISQCKAMQAIPERNSDICPPGSPLAAVTPREESTWLTVRCARALLSDGARITTNVMVRCIRAGAMQSFALKGLYIHQKDLKRVKSSAFIFHHRFNVIKDNTLKPDRKDITSHQIQCRGTNSVPWIHFLWVYADD